MAASQASQQLATATEESSSGGDGINSAEVAALVHDLLEATAVETGRRGVIAALLHTPGAFQSLLSLIKVCQTAQT